MLFGDGGRIGQLLTKLITNAIAVKENADTPSELRISVSTQKDSYAQILKGSAFERLFLQGDPWFCPVDPIHVNSSIK